MTEHNALEKNQQTDAQPSIWLPQVLTTVLLAWALNPDNPYNYYIFLRWVCCLAFAYLAWKASERQKQNWLFIFVIGAILYNPISTVHLQRETWCVVNVATIAIGLVSIVAFRVNRNLVGQTNTNTMTEEFRTCPFCAEQIKRAAILCKHCHSKIRPAYQPPTPKVITTDNAQKTEASTEEHTNLERLRHNASYILSFLLGLAAVVLTANFFHVFSPAKETTSHEQVVSTREEQTEEAGAADTSPAMAEDNSGREVVESILNAQINGPAFSADDIKAIAAKYERVADAPSALAEQENADGLAAVKAEDYKNATEHFERAVAACPSHARYLSNLGVAELFADELDSAESHTIGALGQDPVRAVAWGNLGQIYAKKEDKEKAVACFLIRNTLKPSDTISYLKSLKTDDSQLIQEAGNAALAELQPKEVKDN